MKGPTKFSSPSSSPKLNKNKSSIMTTVRTPTSLKSNQYSKFSAFISENRSQAYSFIDDLIHTMDSKRNDTDSAIKVVGSSNIEAIDSIKNDSFSFSSDVWKKNKNASKRAQVRVPDNQTYINKCLVIPDTAQSSQKDQTIQLLLAQNMRLKEQLNSNNYNKLWKELQELKKENEMLRKDTIKYLSKP